MPPLLGALELVAKRITHEIAGTGTISQNGSVDFFCTEYRITKI